MPTYEYKCEKCGYEFEQFQKMSAEPLKVCPKCGQKSLMRKISGGAGLIFKGSGFYVNDYGNKNKTESPTKNIPDHKKQPTSTQKTEEKTTPTPAPANSSD
ncbi:MAG TPA: zinc ribbon domain-containing protein [Candidatus Marinimicrobia bacterium]|nr:zinc ribbon domain-containing protein [Candidatus Neomarinimicrobiota bacterium]HRS52325.1 zinc ribbon domain-containing protein [Candidatus Neomarinimicrobiota bacterium]HRU92063.1 zinc ribbon domain-containing protein [Candidatus Neomarinimicrobiota bacterium]